MAKLGILFTRSPVQVENWETAAGIAEAALDKGHEVSFFYYLDGVYTPVKYMTFPDKEVMPKDQLEKLLVKGAKVVACGICVNARGLEKGKDYLEGVKVGGLPDFAEIVGEADQLITL